MRDSNVGGAVAAYNDWREAMYEAKVGVESNGTTSFVTYHSWTFPTPIVGGTYNVALTTLAGGPLVAAGTDVEMGFILTLDGIGPQPIDLGPLAKYGAVGGRFAFGFGFKFVLPPGAHTFDFQFRQPAGPGTAQITRSEWSVERWA